MSSFPGDTSFQFIIFGIPLTSYMSVVIISWLVRMKIYLNLEPYYNRTRVYRPLITKQIFKEK